LAAHCDDWVNNPGRSSFDHFGTSYAANDFSVRTWYEIFSNSPYLRKLSGVPNPARTIAFEENIGRWAWAARNERPECVAVLGGLGVDPGPNKTIRSWHGKDWVYNFAFIDGGAGSRQIYNDGTEDHNGYATHYINEHLEAYSCNACDVEVQDCPIESQGSYETDKCVIIRGDGWQLDTMPAPLICTGLSSESRSSFAGCVKESDR